MFRYHSSGKACLLSNFMSKIVSNVYNLCTHDRWGLEFCVNKIRLF